MPVIAKTSADITAQWIDDILRSADALTDHTLHVASINTDLMGNGNMGQVVRVAITYSTPAPGLPSSLAVKLAAAKEERRRYAADRGIYINELRFYRDIASTVDIRVPHCYFAEIDPAEGWFNLVLEDLSKITQPGDSIGGGSLEQAKLALGELVKLQAPRWNDPKLDSIMDSETGKAQMQKQFASFLGAADIATRELNDDLNADQIKLIKALMPLATQWLDSWQPPFVIQHGDYRLDNMLFGITPETPTLVVLDWQITRVGPAMLDVAYFLGECLSIEERRANEQTLLQFYHQALINAGVTDYDFETMRQDYRRYSLFGLLTAVGTYQRIQHTEYSRKLFLNSIQKYADLALDLNAIDTLR